MVDMPSLFWVDHSSPVQMMPPPRALSPCGEEVEKIMAEPDQPRSHKPAAIVNVADFPLETEVVNNCRKSMSEDSASELFKKVMSEIGASVKEEQEQPRHKNEYVIKREPSWKRARKLFSLTGAPTLRNTGSETAVWKPTATTPGSDGWGSAALSGEKCTNEFQICIDENANNATAVSFSSSLLDATKSSIASTSFEFPAEGGENCQSRSCACAVQLPANVSGLCEMSTGGESSVEKNADADSSLPTDLIQDLDQLMTSSSDLFCKGRKSPCKSPRFKGS